MKRSSIAFIVIMFGVNSLLADVIYEGARSVLPLFLKEMGYSALLVGVVLGLAEFTGYLVRMVAGVVADKVRGHWFFFVAGYLLTISVPLLGIADTTTTIVALIFLERIGKGMRSPAKNAILSILVGERNQTTAFAWAEMLDEVGAITGPLVLSIAIFSGNTLQGALTLLWVPFAAVVFMQIVMYFKFSREFQQEIKAPAQPMDRDLESGYWLFVLAASLSIMSTFPAPIILYESAGRITLWAIPLVYLVVHASDLLGTAFWGWLYQRWRNTSLYLVLAFASLTSLLVIWRTDIVIWVTAIIFGVVAGAHESIFRVRITEYSPGKSRGRAFGYFFFAAGVASLLANIVFGYVVALKSGVLVPVILAGHLVALCLLYRALHP